jgi:GLPGLI family protein
LRKIFIFILFFEGTVLLFSQNLSFRYEVKTHTDINRESVKTEDYFLDISDSKSIFRSGHDRYYDSLKQKTGRGLGTPLDFNQLYSRKDKLKNEVYKTVTVPLVLDTYDIVVDEKLDWKLLSDTATIAGLKCQKATVKYGGRIWDAWFTKSIAIQDGPYIFYGLPGLIVQVTDTVNDFKFGLVYYKHKNDDLFFPPKKGKTLTFSEFKILEENFYHQPFAELERSGLKITASDEKGNKLQWDSRAMSQRMQKTLRENNNPPEINYKPDFK